MFLRVGAIIPHLKEKIQRCLLITSFFLMEALFQQIFEWHWGLLKSAFFLAATKLFHIAIKAIISPLLKLVSRWTKQKTRIWRRRRPRRAPPTRQPPRMSRRPRLSHPPPWIFSWPLRSMRPQRSVERHQRPLGHQKPQQPRPAGTSMSTRRARKTPTSSLPPRLLSNQRHRWNRKKKLLQMLQIF